MACLKIQSKLNSIYICGDFCDWNMEKAIKVEKTNKSKDFMVEYMPTGYYKCFDSKTFFGGEVDIYDNNIKDRHFDGVDTRIKIRFKGDEK